MNHSDDELCGNRTNTEAVVDAGVDLLPVLAKALYSAIAEIGHSYRLTTAQVKVLLQISARGQMAVGEIAAALGISMPAASEMVDRLVDAGHLARTSCPEDRRRVLVAATAGSASIAQHLRAVRRAQLGFALDRLSPEERSAFVPVLKALVAGLTHPGLAAKAAGRDDGARACAPAMQTEWDAESVASKPGSRRRAPTKSIAHAHAQPEPERGPQP